jgi:hypothetical protein
MSREADPGWLVLTNHGTVLLSVANDPTIDTAQLAGLVGVAAPEAEEILGDLVAEGYLVRTSESGRTRYDINREGRLRHPLFTDVKIGPLVDAFRKARSDASA